MVLQKFNINGDTKSVSTPLALHFKLRDTTSLITVEEREHVSHVLYITAVGSLMHAMACTRPKLSQVVSMVSRYMHNLGKDRWEAVKRILHHIKGTIGIGLVCKKETDGKKDYMGHVDSDYVGDLDKQRSTMGYNTSELALDFTAYCSIVGNESWVYGHDKGCKGRHLASRVT